VSIHVPVGLTTEGLLAKRYMARFIDGMLLSCVAFATSFLVARWMPDSFASAVTLLLSGLLIVLLWLGYETLLESSTWQATLGKRIMGLKVYDEKGGPLTLPQAAGRNLVKDGPFLLFSLFPGAQLLSVAWLGAHLVVLHRSPVSQAIHDRAARTWVAAPEGTLQLHIN